MTLVKREAADALMAKFREEYAEKQEHVCDCFVTTPCDGAGVIVPMR